MMLYTPIFNSRFTFETDLAEISQFEVLSSEIEKLRISSQKTPKVKTPFFPNYIDLLQKKYEKPCKIALNENNGNGLHEKLEDLTQYLKSLERWVSPDTNLYRKFFLSLCRYQYELALSKSQFSEAEEVLTKALKNCQGVGAFQSEYIQFTCLKLNLRLAQCWQDIRQNKNKGLNAKATYIENIKQQFWYQLIDYIRENKLLHDFSVSHATTWLKMFDLLYKIQFSLTFARGHIDKKQCPNILEEVHRRTRLFISARIVEILKICKVDDRFCQYSLAQSKDYQGDILLAKKLFPDIAPPQTYAKERLVLPPKVSRGGSKKKRKRTFY